MNTSPKAGRTSERGETEGSDAAETLAVEVAALRTELQLLAEQMEAVGVTAVGGAKRAAQALVAESSEMGARATEDALEEWRALDRRVTAETRLNPWRSLGIAALAGLVVGFILRR